MRKLKKSDLIGKTIIDADVRTTNFLQLSFDDETELEIWCEPAVTAAGSSIWGFFVDSDENEDEDDEEESEED